jgi:predicted nucleic acid-binding protein
MVTLIDSSVLIAAERGHLDLPAFLRKSPEEHFVMSAITVSELLHGLHRAAPDRYARRESFIEQALQHFAVLPFDLLSARIHARLWSDLSQAGTPVGAHDLLIGATALAVGARVATRDERSFPRIPGLVLLIP